MKKIFIYLLIAYAPIVLPAQTWNGMGGGVCFSGGNGGNANTLFVFNNKLYVSGHFTQAGNLTCHNIANWDGSKWDTLSNGSGENANDMCDYNGDLVIAGLFIQINNVPNTLNIASYYANSWHDVGKGGSMGANTMYSIKEYKNKLYVGGDMSKIGGPDNIPVNNIAEWNGTTWNNMKGGVTGSFRTVYCMAEYKGKLYVGGDFTKAGGITATGIATWDGTKWDSVGSGADGLLTELFVDSVNNFLYAHGGFYLMDGVITSGLARFDGTTWTSIPRPPTSWGYSNPVLYHGYLVVNGAYLSPSDTLFAYWDGVNWHPLTTLRHDNPNGGIIEMCEYKDELYFCGEFSSVNDTIVNNIARLYLPPNPLSVGIRVPEREKKTSILNNIPNPFNSATQIPYFLKEGQKGSISIYSLAGIKLQEHELEAGQHNLEIQANELKPGIYLYRLKINREVQEVKKMTIIK